MSCERVRGSKMFVSPLNLTEKLRCKKGTRCTINKNKALDKRVTVIVVEGRGG